MGDNKPVHVDVRVISATNKDIKSLVERGIFRDDLFYRINVIPIFLPPLRERLEDIPLLAEYFFRKISLKGGGEIKAIDDEIMNIFTEYPWPGNVRELKSALEYAFVCCRESLIYPHHLPPRFHLAQRPENQQKLDRSNQGEIKRRQLIHALQLSGGNRSEAARILGVSRVTVWNRMKRFGVDIKKDVHS